MAMTSTTKTELLFNARIGRSPEGVAFAPARAELLGSGRWGAPTLLAALPMGVSVAWGVRPDSRIAVWAMDEKAKDRFTRGEWVRTGRRWSDLARGLCAATEQAGTRLPGMDLLVHGDVLRGAGLAASTAYAAALQQAIHAVAGRSLSARERAQEVAEVEGTWGDAQPDPGAARVAVQAEPGDVVFLREDRIRRGALPDDVVLEVRSSATTRMPAPEEVATAEATRAEAAWAGLEAEASAPLLDAMQQSHRSWDALLPADALRPWKDLGVEPSVLTWRCRPGTALVIARKP